LDIVYEANEHARKYPSIAEDTGFNSRFIQYAMTNILNRLGSFMDISDTQAAGALFGLNVSPSSELYTVCDTDACINMTKNEQIFEHQLRTNKDNIYEDKYYEDPDDDVDTHDTIISDTEPDSELSTTNDARDDNDMGNFIFPDGNDNDVSDSILHKLLDNKDMINECETNTMLHCIKTALTNANESLESPEVKFYTSTYGSFPIYKVDNGTRLVSIPYPSLS